MLERYRVAGGERQLLVCPGADASLLVIDRDVCGADARLVAHLHAEEPITNAMLIARLYLADDRGRWCRAMVAEDFEAQDAEPVAVVASSSPPPVGPELVSRDGARYRLEEVTSAAREIKDLRWLRFPPSGELGPAEVVSLRRVVAACEDYEPARSLAHRAVARGREDRRLSVVTVAAELERLTASPIVLNRLLRQAVQSAVQDGVSLSAIAMRCGRVKRDPRGNLSGETSWLGRRLGLLPEAGGSSPTPWVHSDVLALIARRGLRIAPREVELT